MSKLTLRQAVAYINKMRLPRCQKTADAFEARVVALAAKANVSRDALYAAWLEG